MPLLYLAWGENNAHSPSTLLVQGGAASARRSRSRAAAAAAARPDSRAGHGERPVTVVDRVVLESRVVPGVAAGELDSRAWPAAAAVDDLDLRTRHVKLGLVYVAAVNTYVVPKNSC